MNSIVLFLLASSAWLSLAYPIQFTAFSDADCTQEAYILEYWREECVYDSHTGFSSRMTYTGEDLVDVVSYASTDCTGGAVSNEHYARNACSPSGTGSYMFTYTPENVTHADVAITYSQWNDVECTELAYELNFEEGVCSSDENLGTSFIYIIQEDWVTQFQFNGVNCPGKAFVTAFDNGECLKNSAGAFQLHFVNNGTDTDGEKAPGGVSEGGMLAPGLALAVFIMLAVGF